MRLASRIGWSHDGQSAGRDWFKLMNLLYSAHGGLKVSEVTLAGSSRNPPAGYSVLSLPSLPIGQSARNLCKLNELGALRLLDRQIAAVVQAVVAA